MGTTEKISIKEAVEILEAHFTGRFESIYLMDAWYRLKEEVEKKHE